MGKKGHTHNKGNNSARKQKRERQRILMEGGDPDEMNRFPKPDNSGEQTYAKVTQIKGNPIHIQLYQYDNGYKKWLLTERSSLCYMRNKRRAYVKEEGSLIIVSSRPGLTADKWDKTDIVKVVDPRFLREANNIPINADIMVKWEENNTEKKYIKKEDECGFNFGEI